MGTATGAEAMRSFWAYLSQTAIKSRGAFATVSSAQRLRWWQAAILGTLTVAIVGFVMFIFIR